MPAIHNIGVNWTECQQFTTLVWIELNASSSQRPWFQLLLLRSRELPAGFCSPMHLFMASLDWVITPCTPVHKQAFTQPKSIPRLLEHVWKFRPDTMRTNSWHGQAPSFFGMQRCKFWRRTTPLLQRKVWTAFALLAAHQELLARCGKNWELEPVSSLQHVWEWISALEKAQETKDIVATKTRLHFKMCFLTELVWNWKQNAYLLQQWSFSASTAYRMPLFRTAGFALEYQTTRNDWWSWITLETKPITWFFSADGKT